MKSLLVLALALAAAPLASAQMYKYVDKDGKTVYTDQPPANTDPKQLSIPSGPPSASPGAPKSAVERDKELQKGRDEVRDRAKKADDVAKQAEAKEQQCSAARSAYQIYADGGRIAKNNDKGERIFLGDEEIDAARVRSKREMDEACKKS
jgi:Domain of unknown function (DUF4124)